MNSIEKEIPFQHTQEGRLRAMCLWSPAEPRLLNQSAGCDRLTGRVVCLLEENKRRETETKRQNDQGRQTQKRKQKGRRQIGETQSHIQREERREGRIL